MRFTGLIIPLWETVPVLEGVEDYLESLLRQETHLFATPFSPQQPSTRLTQIITPVNGSLQEYWVSNAARFLPAST